MVAVARVASEGTSLSHYVRIVASRIGLLQYTRVLASSLLIFLDHTFHTSIVASSILGVAVYTYTRRVAVTRLQVY